MSRMFSQCYRILICDRSVIMSAIFSVVVIVSNGTFTSFFANTFQQNHTSYGWFIETMHTIRVSQVLT